MKRYIIKGGNKLAGQISVSGSKNVISKAIVAACLTSEEVVFENIPLISDLYVALEVAERLGATTSITDHTLKIQYKDIKSNQIPLDAGAKSRTSSMFIAPLLARTGEAMVPNPGGCRLGARPIDRHIQGLEKMGATVSYYRDDGYFHAKAEKLTGTHYSFDKNTHTGTETLILAAALAQGIMVIENAAEEPEVDDLIALLNQMGAKISRTEPRTIEIIGVESLHGTTFSIMPDRNEAMTFAVLSALTGGNIYIKNTPVKNMKAFFDKFAEAGGKWEEKENGIRFYIEEKILPVDVVTVPHPGFMTDWQGPWSVLMTQATGAAVIHETIYENRFAYAPELKKMGAKLEFFNPVVENPESFYNFNFDENDSNHSNQALKIFGPSKLHNAVLNIADLRAGATLVIAALIASGTSVIFGVEHIERGYEAFDKTLKSVGADIENAEEATSE